VYYFSNTSPCGQLETHWLTVNPKIIAIDAKSNTTTAQIPATILFEAKNLLGTAGTTYRWFFNDPYSGSDDSAQVSSCSHTYTKASTYYPFVIAKAGNCVDTGYCAPIQVNPLSLEENKTYTLFISPNPTLGKDIQIHCDKLIKSIQLLNSQGQMIMNQNCHVNGFTVNSKHLSPGIYFVKIQLYQNSKSIVRPIVVNEH
jgi:hypothetical protein